MVKRMEERVPGAKAMQTVLARPLGLVISSISPFRRTFHQPSEICLVIAGCKGPGDEGR